jgi:hypothetical protein
MGSTIISIIVFILTSIVYYFLLAPKLTIDIISDPSSFVTYQKSKSKMLLLFFLLVLLTQLGLNISVLVNSCGGSFTQNIKQGLLITLVPWILIFGAVIGILMMFPSFKSVFANVIGYFYVSRSANNILSELLVNADIDKTIDEDSKGNEEKTKDLKGAAQAIIKLVGNMSVLINEITPTNFENYWKMLTPLMKPQYQAKNGAPEIKQKLLNIVVSRDNTGEAMWYLYTAILLICVTQYKIMTQGCSNNLTTMQSNHQAYLEKEKEITEKNKKLKSKTYTVTS